jgi:hypothetical protein
MEGEKYLSEHLPQIGTSMKYHSDKDGKSKTASGVDVEHYPEQHEVLNHETLEPDEAPAPEQISARAHELWKARGSPEGFSERDWLQAEADLKKEAAAHGPLKGVQKETGSVQP